MPKQEFDNEDRGYLAKNTDRQGGDKRPTHKGKITLSKATLKALNAMFQDGEEPVIYFAGWPGKNAGMLSLKAEAPQAYRDEGGERGGGGGGSKQRARGDDERGQRGRGRNLDDDAPF